MAEEKTADFLQAEQDAKQLRTLKTTYTIAQFGGGIEKAYYGTYAQMLYTNVYMMSAAFSGLLSMVQTVVGWIGGPVFGALLDGISFKKAKYYPWIIIGGVGYNLGWMLIYSLPFFGVKSGIAALCIACFNACISPLLSVPSSACYPLMSSDAKDRQFFARIQKIMRDGGKTIFGYIFPALLLTLGAGFGETNAYALCVLLAGIPGIAGYIIYGLSIKGSYVERKALDAEKTASGKKTKISMSVIFRTIFANRALLAMWLFMSLHKSYYFLYTSCATYIFRYYFADFGKMSIFMVVFNLTAIIGVMFGPLWKAVFKETKRCFVSAMAVHVILLAVTAVLFKSISVWTFISLFGVSSLFMGMLENYILPMFAASSDYGAWKSGRRLDGVTMSIYSLSVRTGTMLATTIRTAVLIAANLDAVTAGGEITAGFLGTLSSLFSWLPLGLGIASLLCLAFLFHLTDERIKLVNEDIAAGITASSSQHKF